MVFVLESRRRIEDQHLLRSLHVNPDFDQFLVPRLVLQSPQE